MAGLGIALWTGLDPNVGVVLLMLLALALAAFDARLGRTDGRWYALGFTLAALARLADAAAIRAPGAPAFVDVWGMALWAVTAGAAGLAGGLRREEGADPIRGIRNALWVLAGGLLLFGVTGELGRLFEQQVRPESARLAGGLAVSAWWLLFAGALVALGFRRSHAPVRQAGLAVAALALLKVVLVDLAELDALYRVASVLILGCVSLGIAYLYHQRARGAMARTE
jgi:hypothetical protein